MTRYGKLDSNIFIENRKRFVAQMKPNSMAVFHSGDQFLQSADANHAFIQNPDLFYLTGISQEDTILVLYPDAPEPKWREMLFLKETSETILVWEGYKYTKEQAKEISGIERCVWNTGFDGQFEVMMHYAQNLYLNLNEHDRAHFDGDYKNLRFAKQCKERFPLHEFERSAPILSVLRTSKSSGEVALMQKACDITEKAFRRTLGFIKPGVMEYEIEAEITHEFIRNTASHAYNPILASGVDSCILHYNDNNKACGDGEIILMDFGCEFAGYASDMTRTVPVNGKFTDRQKTIYNSVLKVHNETVKLMNTTTTLGKINAEVEKIMESELIALGLLDKDAVAKQNPDAPLFKKYYPHGVAHFLGLNVHDIGNKYATIPSGTVLTVEPGIYIRDEKIGIRIENNILITDNGVVDLMKNIPIEVAEIEELMRG
jgi:Xaa-Pro aminopeptidase